MEIGEDPTKLPRFSAAMKSQMDATPREGATNGRGMSSPQVASPQRSSMEPKTPALPPPGSHRISGLADADAAAIGCPSAANRWLPGVPAGAAALFRDSDRSEWGLSEELAPVARQLADQFERHSATGERRADDGGCAVNQGDESIRSHFVVNEREQLQNSQELGSKAAIAQPDWRRPYSLPERAEDEEWALGTAIRWRDESKAPTWGFYFGLVAREWPRDVKEEVDRESWRQGKISIFTGWELVWADPKDLIWLPPDASVPRVLSHGLASPSPEKPSLEPLGSRLEWVSSQGLLDAECLELPIKRPSIPHLIGKQGRQIRFLKEKLGVIIGVMDEEGNASIVSLVGPMHRLVVARRIVELFSKGDRTLLDRWDWDSLAG